MSDHRWRVLRAAVAHATPWFRVLRSAVARPDGSIADFHTLDFPRPAVSILLRDEADRVLLIRQHRFIVGRDVWALPSGGVEDGEFPEAAAARELVEETGFAAGRLSHLLSYYPSYGVSNQVFHCYLAESPRPVRAFDSNEVSHTTWRTPPEIRDLIRSGEIPDGFSLTPLLFLAADLSPQSPHEVSRCRRFALDAPDNS